MKGMVSFFYLGMNRSLKRMWLVLVTFVVSFPISFLCGSLERSNLLLFLIATTNYLAHEQSRTGRKDFFLWKKRLPPPGEREPLIFCPPAGGVRFVFWFEAPQEAKAEGSKF